MTEQYGTCRIDARQDPTAKNPVEGESRTSFRYSRLETAGWHADYFNPDNPPVSQRQFAKEHGIPRSTLSYHLSQSGSSDLDPHTDAFLRSLAGCRASSCTEGRNGRLSLYRHGHTRISDKKLKMLTTLHNYFSLRSDGTTAAQRFFGHKPNDLFEHLLDKMPDLPRPAAKRSPN